VFIPEYRRNAPSTSEKDGLVYRTSGIDG